MTRRATIAPTDPVNRLALDIRDVTQAKGDCLEADMRLKGWTDAELDQYRQAALSLVRQWNERAEADRRADLDAGHQETPQLARRAGSQIGTARSRLDFLAQKLGQLGAGTRRTTPAPRAIDALDEAIDLLTATRRELTGQPYAPRSAAGRAAA